MSDEEEKSYEALKAEYEKLEDEYAEADELPEEVDARLGEIETAMEALQDRPIRFSDAVVSMMNSMLRAGKRACRVRQAPGARTLGGSVLVWWSSASFALGRDDMHRRSGVYQSVANTGQFDLFEPHDLGFAEITIAALIGHAKGSVTSKYVHTLDSTLIMAADTVSG